MNNIASCLNAVMMCRLSLERCQVHLAHLHALLHLFLSPGRSDDSVELVVENMRKVMAGMERDLTGGADILNRIDENGFTTDGPLLSEPFHKPGDSA